MLRDLRGLEGIKRRETLDLEDIEGKESVKRPRGLEGIKRKESIKRA
ncbi:hypothetical protein ACIROS_29650 [Bacillus mobilis]